MRNKNPDTLLLPFINSCSPVTIAFLERFADQGSDGLSYIHLFREKNRAKQVAKYQLFQLAIPHILMSTIKVFLSILSSTMARVMKGLPREAASNSFMSLTAKQVSTCLCLAQAGLVMEASRQSGSFARP